MAIQPFIGYDIAFTTIAIMICAAGIVLGIGIALGSKKLKQLGSEEIYQSIINIAIISILFFAFSQYGIITNAINGIVGGAQVTAVCQSSMSSNYAICFGYNYLVGVNPITIGGNSYPSLFEYVVALLLPVSTAYATFSAFSIVNLGTLFAPLLSILSYMIKALSFSLISIEVQAALLKFSAAIAIPLLLPIGMVLRTFYFTRKLGGAIMAIAIGLFAVFPLTYLLDAELVNNYSNVFSQSSITTFNLTASQITGSITNQPIFEKSNTSNSISLGAILSTVAGFGTSMINMVKQLMNLLALLIVAVFFLPVFSVILTVISIREFARILGSEISFGRFDIF